MLHARATMQHGPGVLFSLVCVLFQTLAFVSTAQARASGSIEDLVQMENDVEEVYRALVENGQTAEDMFRDLESSLGGIPEEQVTAFSRGQIEGVEPANLERLQALNLRIEAWNERQGVFERMYDRLIIAKTDFFIDHTMSFLEVSYQEMREQHPNRQFKLLQHLLNRAKKQYKKYVENRHQYGGPKDTLRLAAYKRFFRAAAKYVENVNYVTKFGRMPIQSWLSLASDWTRTAVLGAKVALSAPVETLQVVGRLAFPFGEWFQSALTKLGHLFVAAGQALGHTVVIENRENIPATEENTINLFVPNHSDMESDIYTVGAIIKDVAPDMMALSAVQGQMFLRPWAERNHAVVSVGRDRKGNKFDPIAIVKERLTNLGRKNLLAYGEGSLAIGYKETRPVREKFTRDANGDGLIQSIRDEFRINIIPITSRDGYKFLNSHDNPLGADEPGQEILRLNVHRPITTAMTDLLLSHQKALNRMLRGIWTDVLSANGGTLLGQARTGEIAERMYSFVRGRGLPTYLVKCEMYLDRVAGKTNGN